MDALGFIFKKVISRFFFPVGAVLVVLVAGLIIWRRHPRRRLGPFLVGAAFVLLLILSLPVTGWLLLTPLERQAGDYADPAVLASRGVRHIVVLGAAAWPGKRTAADSQNGAGLRRLLEGVRLHKGLPDSRLVLSGGSFLHIRNPGQAMRDLALFLGVSPKDIIMEEESWDTRDQARLLVKVLGSEPFALVTSANHLPRALLFFKSRGLNPLPAPCDFRTRGYSLSYESFLPSAGGLRGCETALYEYLGTIWAKLST